MSHGSLFSGIGGFDLAAQWMGWTNIFHCEWNEFGQKVLKYYRPNAISYGDITKTDFSIHRGSIDILTGGFPCQPFSVAGKRKGTEDDRHLWPEMLRAIREIQPKWIVGENVSGIVSWDGGLVFEQVCADLEVEGYEVQPVILPAVSVNAPHRRDRVWFIAYRTDSGVESLREPEKPTNQSFTAPDTDNIGRNNGGDNRKERHIQINKRTSEEDKPEREGRISGVSEVGAVATYSDGGSRKAQRQTTVLGQQEDERQTDGYLFRSDRTKQWDSFPTQSPVCSRNDGLPTGLSGVTVSKHRNESIKAYGNAIVPQVAFEIFKVIEQMNFA